MTYAYCHACEVGMDAPTFEECVRLVHVCHMCSHEHGLNREVQVEAIIQLEQRITALETKAEPSEELLNTFFDRLSSSISSSDGHTGIPIYKRPMLVQALVAVLKGE